MDLSQLATELNKTQEELELIVEEARRSLTPRMERIEVVERGVARVIQVTRVGVGPLLTHAGPFHHFLFRIQDEWEDYSALVKADLDQKLNPVFQQDSPLLLRIDSGCETGQVFGDKTCECRDQLHKALETIEKNGEGVLVNIPHQDGRGLGLGFKLATLFVQEELGVGTVTASALLDPAGATRDARTYGGVIAILRFFGVLKGREIALMSNNPKKLEIFEENGHGTPQFVEVQIEPTEHTRHHLLEKQEHLGHVNLVPTQEDDAEG
jgi:3,4-dihydroxy 2-butanone 4-phosphate synthase/GTP cyclohydrolase II